MPSPRDEELDSTPLEGDRPGSHPEDVLDDLPVDGDQTHETQLMSDAELDPKNVEGDRFDVNDDDLGTPPDLEEEPGAAPDLQPDRVVRFAETTTDGEPEPVDVDDEPVVGRPIDLLAEDELIETPELP